MDIGIIPDIIGRIINIVYIYSFLSQSKTTPSTTTTYQPTSSVSFLRALPPKSILDKQTNIRGPFLYVYSSLFAYLAQFSVNTCNIFYY